MPECVYALCMHTDLMLRQTSHHSQLIAEISGFSVFNDFFVHQARLSVQVQSRIKNLWCRFCHGNLEDVYMHGCMHDPPSFIVRCRILH